MTPKMTQTILINGAVSEHQPQTVRELLVATGIQPDRPGIAVAINEMIVPRATWDTRTLQPNDQVEIINALAGG